MGRKLGLLTSTTLATSTALVMGAAAADLRMPVKAPPSLAPTFSWGGCYVGGNVGAVSSDVEQRFEFIEVIIENDSRRTGFTGGAQVGCNVQFAPNWVGGIEGDLNFVDASHRRSFALTFVGEDVTGTHATKLNWLGTVRGRFGPTWGRTLVYATGGLAVGNVRSSLSGTSPFTGGAFSGSRSDTRVGWTFGGGIEHAFTDRISAKLEYLHFDLGSEPFNVTSPAGTLTASSRMEGDLIRAGLNLKLN